MTFDLEKSIQVLERTPKTLRAMLDGVSSDWILNNEGGESWSPYDIVGHLIHGEKTDWIPRAKIILSESPDKNFEPFDRFAQMHVGEKQSLTALLEEFETWRGRNIAWLRAQKIAPETLEKTGMHPAFGAVTLSQLLATWVVHDLNHIAQISRVMAKQYKAAVGPWIEYLRILQ